MPETEGTQLAHPHVESVRAYLDNAGITPETHEALWRSWIFDLLTGMADTMTAQHPAAPETETDANGWLAALTEVHRDSYPMGNIHHGTPENPDWGTFCVECKESWPCDVSRLLQRVRVVEGERDEWKSRAFAAVARAESAEAANEALRKECADHLRAIESAHDAALSAARIRTLEAALHAQAQQDRAETAEAEVERLTEGALPSPDDTDEKETA